MKWTKVVLLIIACSSATLAFVAWRGMLTLRQGMAECLNWQANLLAERFVIDDTKNRELLTEISGFSQKVADGRQPAMSGFAVLRSFYDGPLLLTLLHISLVNHTRAEPASEESEQQNIEEVSLQFFSDVYRGKIANEDWQKVRNLLLEEKISETESSIGFVIPEQIESFRRNIGQKALSDCINIMQQACSKTATTGSATVIKSSIPPTAFDPVAELKKILASAR